MWATGKTTGGDKVVTWYVSANRDEGGLRRRRPVRRNAANDHVTFGREALISAWARIWRGSGRRPVRGLLPRIASIELAGPAGRVAPAS
jgi:hypothetical protein